MPLNAYLVGSSILITGGSSTSRLAQAKKYASLEFDVSKIDEIREVQHLIATGQSVIITHAQNLTEEAQNALLKVLEESDSNIVLLAENEDQLLPTVVSRCFIINLQGFSEIKAEDVTTREGAINYIDNLMATRPYKILRQLFQAKKYLRANTNVRLTLESLLVNC